MIEGQVNGTRGPFVLASQQENQVEGLPLTFGPQHLEDKTRVVSEIYFQGHPISPPWWVWGSVRVRGMRWPWRLSGNEVCVYSTWRGEVLGRISARHPFVKACHTSNVSRHNLIWGISNQVLEDIKGTQVFQRQEVQETATVHRGRGTKRKGWIRN